MRARETLPSQLRRCLPPLVIPMDIFMPRTKPSKRRTNPSHSWRSSRLHHSAIDAYTQCNRASKDRPDHPRLGYNSGISTLRSTLFNPLNVFLLALVHDRYLLGRIANCSENLVPLDGEASYAPAVQGKDLCAEVPDDKHRHAIALRGFVLGAY